MARGKSNLILNKGKGAPAGWMPKSFPCQAPMPVPCTHLGCRALGGSENLPGPQQQMTAEDDRMGFTSWGLHTA